MPERGVARAGDLARRLEHLVEHRLGIELRQQAAADVDEAAQPLLVEMVVHGCGRRTGGTVQSRMCGEPAGSAEATRMAASARASGCVHAALVADGARPARRVSDALLR